MHKCLHGSAFNGCGDGLLPQSFWLTTVVNHSAYASGCVRVSDVCLYVDIHVCDVSVFDCMPKWIELVFLKIIPKDS